MRRERFAEAEASGVPDWRLFGRLLHYVRPYRWTAVLGVTMVLVAGALVIVGPLLIRNLIDEGIKTGDEGRITLLAMIFLGIEILRFGVEYVQGYLLQRLGQLSMRDLRMDVFAHLQKLPMRFYEEQPVGRIVTRTTNDVASLQELFSVGLVTLFKDIVLVGGIAITMLAVHFELGLVTLAAAPLVFLAVTAFRRRLRAAYRRVRGAVGRANATMQENLSGVRTIRIFGLEADRHGRFRSDNEELREAVLASVRTHAVFSPFVSVASATAMALVFWYGGDKVIQGAIGIGTLVAYIQWMPHLLTPIRDVGEKFNILQSALAAAERIFGVLDTKPEIIDRGEPAPLGEVKGEVELRGVRFGYREGREVLHEIDLRIRPGERVALVGRTGSGKTTISKLIARFYDPWSGTVRLDGRDLRGIPLADLRRQVAVVPQDVFIFSASALENVRLGDPALNRDRVVDACRRTNAHTFIERLPRGYDEPLAEGGGNLSVGERQLLALARALARRPAVLILDEATANVDTRTERLIAEATERMTRGRTTIVIAHRLSTIKNADRVVVIEEGRIVQDGPPEDLLCRAGLFRHMHRLQFQEGGT